MRVKYGDREYQAVSAASLEGQNKHIAALQRETGWSMQKIQEMGSLEFVAMQMMVFFTLRANGDLVTFSKAGDLLDEVEFLVDDGDLPPDGEDEDPTSAPTGSGRGDDEAVDVVAVGV